MTWRKRAVIVTNAVLASAWVGVLVVLLGCGLVAMWIDDAIGGKE